MTAGGLDPDDEASFPGVAPTRAGAMAGTGTVQRTRWGPVIALGLAMLVVTSEMTIAAVPVTIMDESQDLDGCSNKIAKPCGVLAARSTELARSDEIVRAAPSTVDIELEE